MDEHNCNYTLGVDPAQRGACGHAGRRGRPAGGVERSKCANPTILVNLGRFPGPLAKRRSRPPESDISMAGGSPT